jgi:hypothetical protein
MILETTFTLLLVAWEPTGLRWSSSQFPIPYCITTNGTNTNVNAAGQRAAIEGAIESWVNTNNGGTLSCTTFVAAPAGFQCTTGVNGNDAEPNIFFEDNWGNGSGAIGVTWSTSSGVGCGSVTDDGGQNHSLQCKYDSDIELNDANYFWTNNGGGTDIQSISVHEFGHFIGLDHCGGDGQNNGCDLGDGVMYAAYPGGEIRTLFNDDVQGACALYPGTPGGLGWPCANNGQCTSGICVNAGTNGYCTQTCGSCPNGFLCDANPQNPGQMVCLRDDGLNKDQCEVCQLSIPGACIDNGICIQGLPSNSEGRCVMPCGGGGTCDMNYQCVQVQFQDGSTGDYCFPRSSDCNDPGNFTELQLGQACSGNPPCAAGLECVGAGAAGICSPECTNNPSGCPMGWACADFQGGVSYCLPAVNEGQPCQGNVACSVGPCLITSGTNATCFRDCAGNPSVCNNAQQCNTYNLQGGGTVSICEPPGVPPNPPDAGVVDTGVPPPPDSGVVGPDGGPVPDSGVVDPKPDAGGQNPQVCSCDITFGCDNCDCDPECACDCDVSFACDPRCDSCDPECGGSTATCLGCTAATPLIDPTWSLVIGAVLAGLLFVRRR